MEIPAGQLLQWIIELITVLERLKGTVTVLNDAYRTQFFKKDEKKKEGVSPIT
jgi:hypothetical protein